HSLYGLRARFTRLSLSKQFRRESKKRLTAKRLHDALVKHRVGDFDEPCDIRTNHKITWFSVLGGGFPRVLENGRHDVAQTRINFLARPRQAHRVLAHLKPARGHT